MTIGLSIDTRYNGRVYPDAAIHVVHHCTIIRSDRTRFRETPNATPIRNPADLFEMDFIPRRVGHRRRCKYRYKMFRAT